jgi:hypothetical protein
MLYSKKAGYIEEDTLCILYDHSDVSGHCGIDHRIDVVRCGHWISHVMFRIESIGVVRHSIHWSIQGITMINEIKVAAGATVFIMSVVVTAVTVFAADCYAGYWIFHAFHWYTIPALIVYLSINLFGVLFAREMGYQ